LSHLRPNGLPTGMQVQSQNHNTNASIVVCSARDHVQTPAGNHPSKKNHTLDFPHHVHAA